MKYARLFILLSVFGVCGCAAAPRSEAPQAAVKQEEPAQKKDAPPTFIYRPGS